MKRESATRDYSFKRIERKLLIALARMYVAPSKMRIWLLRRAGVHFSDPVTAFIGDNVRIDDARPDMIKVGRYVRITSGSMVLTHFFDTKHEGTPQQPFHFTLGQVIIGDYVFIGADSIIASPVTIGDWSVVGANTVITTDVPAGAIVVGTPARVIGFRKGFSQSI